ncbi:MAG: alpha/beta fold hydrolase [Alphaproteobacteria bacterium]|nr:alpha/beta fold hydrolase [Alphaproteobacteria bacterium]
MHGKGGSPNRYAEWIAVLQQHGYLAATPEMCWSARRQYDRPYSDCLTEIDAAVAGLRQRGAKSIVLVGHSLGGTAAINYGATHDGVAGVIGLAASDSVWVHLPPDLQQSVDRARALVALGKGDTVGSFADMAAGHPLTMRTTAANYLTFLAPESQVMLARAAQLRAPLLMIGGSADPVTRNFQETAYGLVPSYALNRLVTVPADHYHVPIAAEDTMLQWLGKLQAQ